MFRTTHVGRCAATLLFALPSLAEISGQVAGSVTFIDGRERWDQGSELDGVRGERIPAANVLVRVMPIDDQNLPTGDSFYAKTDDDGVFYVNWIDPSRDDYPVDAFIDVIWESPTILPSLNLPIDTMITEKPERRFGIRVGLQGSSGARPTTRNEFTLEQLTFVGYHLGESDFSNAYATSEEFFRRVIDGENAGTRNAAVDARLREVNVNIHALLNITPDKQNANIQGGRETGAPFTIAHELGHAATWAALGGDRAFVFSTDYCLNLQCGWTGDENEFERVAFVEGMADALAAAWLWDRTADGPKRIARGVRRGLVGVQPDFFDNTIVVTIDEDTDGRVNIEQEQRCETDIPQFRQHQLPMCQALALWDVLDDTAPTRAEQDDMVSYFNTGLVFEVLDAYPDQCSDDANHCSNEGGVDGLNHHDFAFNFSRPGGELLLERESDIEQVFTLNGITGGHE